VLPPPETVVQAYHSLRPSLARQPSNSSQVDRSLRQIDGSEEEDCSTNESGGAPMTSVYNDGVFQTSTMEIPVDDALNSWESPGPR
jgi:hypothetical protein